VTTDAEQPFRCPGYEDCMLGVNWFYEDGNDPVCPNPECGAVMDYTGYPSGAWADCPKCGHTWIG
jgi:hypothetical protein